MSDDVHTLAAPYALDALPAEEQAFFERHLTVCHSCLQEVAQLRETAAALGEASAETPPAGMRDRVLAEARRTPQEGVPAAPAAPPALAAPAAPPAPPARAAGPTPARRRFDQRLRPVMATAAAVVVLALVSIAAAVTMLADRNAELESQLAQARDVVDVLSQPDVRIVELDSPAGTRARLLYGPETDEAALVLDGLADLPEDEAYQLWVMHAGTPLPDRVFRPDQEGRAVVSVERGVVGADAVAVTVEPREGSAEPTSDILIQGGLTEPG